MGKKTDTLTDFDKQLIAGMEEVVAHINGAPNNGNINEQQASNRLGLGSGVFALGSPRALEFTLKLSF